MRQHFSICTNIDYSNKDIFYEMMNVKKYFITASTSITFGTSLKRMREVNALCVIN